MSTHNICFPGEIRKIKYIIVEKVLYLERWLRSLRFISVSRKVSDYPDGQANLSLA